MAGCEPDHAVRREGGGRVSAALATKWRIAAQAYRVTARVLEDAGSKVEAADFRARCDQLRICADQLSPEVTAPRFTETLPDGTAVLLHQPPELRLGEEARHAVQAIHRWTDIAVSEQLKEGGFHPGTAQAVMMIYRDALRALDPALAESITPRLTELAVSARPMVPPSHPES